MKLVTLDEAKFHLNIGADEADHDDLLDIYIDAASETIVDHLQDNVSEFIDSNGDVILDSEGNPETPKKVKVATLMLVGIFFRDREGSEVANWPPGFLPPAIISLLCSRRDPTCA